MQQGQDPPPPPPPPAPPPQPEPPVYREPKPPGTLAMVGAIALLVAVQLPQAFIPADDASVDGVPYRVGKSVGGFLVATVIGYFVWWLVRRSRPAGTPKWSPWVFVIAAGVASLSLFGQLAERGAAIETDAAESEALPPYESPAEDFLIETPGYTYVEIGPKQERAMSAAFASGAGSDVEADIAARKVVDDESATVVGAVVVFLLESPSVPTSRQAFEQGFEGSSDIELEPTTIAGFEASEGSGPQGTFITVFDRNVIIQTFAQTEAIARELAASQAAAFDG